MPSPRPVRQNRPVRMESMKRCSAADTTEFRRLFTEHLVTEAGAEPSGKTLANVLFKYGDTLEAVMGRQHANDLRAIATAMERAQGNTMGQQGQGLIRIGQGSVAMSMVYSNMQPGRAAAVMLIPGALSWMLMRPQVATGCPSATLPPTAKEAIKVVARIKALAKADQMPIYEVPASWLEQGPPAGAPPLPVQPPREASARLPLVPAFPANQVDSHTTALHQRIDDAVDGFGHDATAAAFVNQCTVIDAARLPDVPADRLQLV